MVVVSMQAATLFVHYVKKQNLYMNLSLASFLVALINSN
jgi:hypothetical protein